MIKIQQIFSKLINFRNNKLDSSNEKPSTNNLFPNILIEPMVNKFVLKLKQNTQYRKASDSHYLKLNNFINDLSYFKNNESIFKVNILI